MTDELLVVELVEPVAAAEIASVAGHASQRLGIPVDRVRKLLDGRVGAITRALRADKAEVIAEAFEAAGARVVVRLADLEEINASPEGSHAVRRGAAVSFGSPSDWGVEGGAAWSREPAEQPISDEPEVVALNIEPEPEPAETLSRAPVHEVLTTPEIDAEPALNADRADPSGEGNNGGNHRDDFFADDDLFDDDETSDAAAPAGNQPGPPLAEQFEDDEPFDDDELDDNELDDDTPPLAAAPVPSTREDPAIALRRRHTPPPLPWLPRTERAPSPAREAPARDKVVVPDDAGMLEEDFDFVAERPTPLSRLNDDAAQIYREMWDDPAARQRRRTGMAVLLLIGVFVLVGLQWWLAEPQPGLAGPTENGQGSTIEVLPPSR